MIEATLCFLVRGSPVEEVLLGFKKVGFGQGKHNGIGGKIESMETVAEAAVREVGEEISVNMSADGLERAAYLTFGFPERPDWDQTVYVFIARDWEGSPLESNEMRPEWFAVTDIPFSRMWADDRYWLPQVLCGRRVRGRFEFAADNETLVEYTVESWDGEWPDRIDRGLDGRSLPEANTVVREQ